MEVRKLLIDLLRVLAIFITYLVTVIVVGYILNSLLPGKSRSLDPGLVRSKEEINTYLLFFNVLLPLSGVCARASYPLPVVCLSTSNRFKAVLAIRRLERRISILCRQQAVQRPDFE